MKTNGIGHTIKKLSTQNLNKANIRSEDRKLQKDRIDFYKPMFTDGVVVPKVTMSNYILSCYTNSVALKDGIHCDLTYMYYLDKLNNTCVLFTDIYSDHNDNDKTKLDKEDYIVVEIYISPEYFMVSELANYYQNNYVDDHDTYDWDNNYFITNSNAYNKISIVKAVYSLLGEKALKRKNTIYNIIK
jgi:hypothetical protein